MLKRIGKYSIFLFIILSVGACGSKSYFYGDFQIVASDLDFPEGPSWYDGRLVFSNCYSGWIGSVVNNSLDTLLSAKDGLINTNGTTFDQYGNLYICDYGRGAILKYTSEGELLTLSAWDEDGKRFNRPNDITVSPTGMLYFTDPKSYHENMYDGRLFRCDPVSGETVWLIKGLQFPNGLCFSPDGKILYIGESVNKNILRINSSVGTMDTLITLPQGNQDPDGMDCDIKGNLYIAYFGGGKIYVVSPQGELLDSLITPGRRPSNLEFGGPDMKTLFITECQTNTVYSIRTKFAGNKKY
jgi:gluconolactonase